MIEEIFYDCDYHQEIKTEYGYFLTRDSAKKFIVDNGLELYDNSGIELYVEGYRVVEIQQNVG